MEVSTLPVFILGLLRYMHVDRVQIDFRANQACNTAQPTGVIGKYCQPVIWLEIDLSSSASDRLFVTVQFISCQVPVVVCITKLIL
jgi:hypothetical protein